MICTKAYGNLLSTVTKVTRDRGDPISTVTLVMSWNEDLLDVEHPPHDSWVAYSRIWSRRSLHRSCGRAPTCRNQYNVLNSRRLLHVTLKFETKILRSDIFAKVNLVSAAPTLQNLRIGLRRRQSGKSKVPAKQRGSWPTNVLKLKEKKQSNILLTFGK